MGIIDIAWDLRLFCWILNTQVDDSEPPSIEYFLLSVCEQLKKFVFFLLGVVDAKDLVLSLVRLSLAYSMAFFLA